MFSRVKQCHGVMTSKNDLSYGSYKESLIAKDELYILSYSFWLLDRLGTMSKHMYVTFHEGGQQSKKL